MAVGVDCKHFWINAIGRCTECGEFPGLPHQHRFPRYQAGDTMPVCEDCRQTVVITPQQAADLAGVKLPTPPEPTTIDLIFAATNGKLPPYMKIVEAFDRMTYGRI